MKREGYTLIEMIVVFAIMTVMIALLLGAVQKVRTAAARIAVQNQVRQLSLAVHSVEADRGRLPLSFSILAYDAPLVDLILPQLGYESRYLSDPSAVFPAFVSKLDPTYAFYPERWEGNSSFAFNYLVFESQSTAGRIPDGRSNTVMLAERYARCGPGNMILGQGVDVSLHGSVCIIKDLNGNMMPSRVTPRSVTFAERYTDDILPVYDPATRTSSGSVAGFTFQVTPRPDQCDSRVVQASTQSGLVVALMDGSVRTISPSIDPAVYWSSMTPDKGEVVNLD